MGGSTRDNGGSRKHRLRRSHDWLVGASVDRRHAHVDGGGSERLRDRGNTLDGRGRNQMGWHSWFVVYRDLDLNVGCMIHMWLPYFSWLEFLSYTLVRMLRKEEVGGSRPPGST